MTSTPSTSSEHSRSVDIQSSNNCQVNKNQINRASNDIHANRKSSYKGECVNLGPSVFHISNIKQVNNFSTVYEAIIA